ncbi:MAG: hypothetical protein ABI693_13595 [Bryobacteraceae bacterium]
MRTLFLADENFAGRAVVRLRGLGFDVQWIAETTCVLCEQPLGQEPDFPTAQVGPKSLVSDATPIE